MAHAGSIIAYLANNVNALVNAVHSLAFLLPPEKYKNSVNVLTQSHEGRVSKKWLEREKNKKL